ncbi:SCO family protein [Halomonas halocynthiae]|uniref:SCO family protein n=1 Tax=Halomonas halocynthiae TaxID=176290 RepID=UPI0004292582|nr:SCO family protein [Halomonas halocynthiae]
MKRTGPWAVVAVVVVAIAVTLAGWWGDRQRNSDGLPEGGDIALNSTVGEFSLSQLDEDQLAVVFFGYTWCPDVCPVSLGVLNHVRQQLNEKQRQRIVPLMVSVDPERDTLERLTEYLAFFGDGFIGATGSEAELKDIAERYQVVWRKVDTPDSAADYTIDHSALLYVVNREGEILRRVLHSSTPEPLLTALEEQLGI